MTDEPKKKKDHGCLIAGCIIGLLLVAFAGGFGVFMYRGYQSFTPVAQNFLTAIDSGDYKAAYSMAGSKWKAMSTYDQFSDFESTIKNILGTHVSTSMTSMNYSSVNGLSTARVVYNAQFSNGPATLTFTLEENGVWVVQGLHYNSDLIQKAMNCPGCKTQNAALGKFCTNCGKPMPAGQVAPTSPTPAEAPDPQQK